MAEFREFASATCADDMVLVRRGAVALAQPDPHGGCFIVVSGFETILSVAESYEVVRDWLTSADG